MLNGMQKLKYPSSVSDLEIPSYVQRNQNFVVRHLAHVILERASYAHVSVTVNLHY